MNYSFHPHTERELEEVERYYDNIREELGNRFRAEIEMAISRILDFPNAWQRLSQALAALLIPQTGSDESLGRRYELNGPTQIQKFS